MKPHLIVDKPVGVTPLETLTSLRERLGLDSGIPLTYAGRLDPMASGKLLVLVGDECKRQDAYRGLDKEYEIEVLLDLATDTADVLGMPSHLERSTQPGRESVARAARTQRGTRTVPYPAFSSKTVRGKPLFLYALEGSLETIDVPSHEETIHSIKVLGIQGIGKEALRTRIAQILALAPRTDAASKELGADFRQDSIRAAWETAFDAIPERRFTVLRLRVTCASGTYMRSLAERIASELGTTGLALFIHRTRIGRLRRILGLGIWTKQY